MALDTDTIAQYRGANLVDSSGDKIGKIEEIYLDDRTGNPEWVLVNTGMFGTKSQFVPLSNASVSGDNLAVPYAKTMVKDAPGIDADGHLSEDEERQLWAYYSRDDYDTGSDTTTTGTTSGVVTGVADDVDVSRTTTTDYDRDVARDVSGPETDDAMTLAEERINVGTEQREAGRARLRKYIVTEEVTKTVPVSREQVTLEREPITDANRDAAYSGPDLSEEEVEVTLTEEVPVVDKDVVATERVRLDKETVTEQRTVSDTVRREEAELVEGETTTRRDVDVDVDVDTTTRRDADGNPLT